MLKAIYGSGGVVNPLSTILRQADTLGLSGAQADSIATLNRTYVIRLDSIWSPVTKYLAALPDNYNRGDAYRRYQRARETTVDMLIKLAPDIKRLLTPEQRRKLPTLVTSYLDARYLASIRSGTAGRQGGSMMSPGGMMTRSGDGEGWRRRRKSGHHYSQLARNHSMQKRTLGLALVALIPVVNQIGEAQSLPPVRQLGPVTAVAREPLGAVSSVRHLPDGRVLVNDILGRRVVMFDSSLATTTVVADTTSATANAYGPRPGGLIAYRGDSTLFIDPASSLDAAHRSERKDRSCHVGSTSERRRDFLSAGRSALQDSIRRAGSCIARHRTSPGSGDRRVVPGTVLPEIPTLPDSAALVRFDLATRKVDTVTFFKTPKMNLNVTQSPDGGMRVTSLGQSASAGRRLGAACLMAPSLSCGRGTITLIGSALKER